MKYILMVLALVLLAAPAFAHDHAAHGPVDIITVGVDGMVCDFCARSLEKAFYQQENVKGVEINLDTASMILEIDKGTELKDEKINELVYYAGYKVREIKR